MLGMCCYMAFFFGILHTNKSLSLMFLAFWREWQTVFSMRHLSQFDGSFSTLTGDSQYFIKAFVSSGQFLLPLIISLLVGLNCGSVGPL